MTNPNNSNTYLPPVIQIPSALEISAITKSYPMVVNISANSDQYNSYLPGQLVKFTVPRSYGMQQVNGLTGQILSASTSSLSINIDSTGFDAFIVPTSGEQPASLAPSGSRNLSYNNSTNQLPFQSLNNIGN
jgi:hypothetical protein